MQGSGTALAKVSVTFVSKQCLINMNQVSAVCVVGEWRDTEVKEVSSSLLGEMEASISHSVILPPGGLGWCDIMVERTLVEGEMGAAVSGRNGEAS